MATRTDANGTMNFVHDADGRLHSAYDTQLNTAEFRYDALGRRIRRSDPFGSPWRYTYDGEDAILVSWEGSPTGLASKYVFAPGVDRLVASQAAGASEAAFHMQDHLGTTTATAPQWGTVTYRGVSDAFGNGGAGDFTGREFDQFTGLYYYRARMYDPQLGRFTAEDPIGFAGGDVNLYGYVRNNPVNFTDPSGLFPFTAFPFPYQWPRTGSEVAARLDAGVGFARAGLQADPSYWGWNGSVNTVCDIAAGASDMLRVGEGLGQAMYEPDLPDHIRFELFANDVVRGGSLILTFAGPAAGRAGGTAKPPTPPNPIVEWLGPNPKVITTPSGDKVFLSANGARKVRFDLNKPYPHTNPHMHAEELINGNWVKSGPVYPKGVPQY